MFGASAPALMKRFVERSIAAIRAKGKPDAR